MDEPGSVLYSSHETLRSGKAYLLDFNPGGSGGQSIPSVAQHDEERVVAVAAQIQMGEIDQFKPGFGRLVLFCLLSSIWFGPIYFFREVMMGMPSTGIAMLIIWLALPIATMHFYATRVHKEITSRFWQKQIGYLERRTTLAWARSLSIGLVLAFLVFYQILTWQNHESMILVGAFLMMFFATRHPPLFLVKQRVPMLQYAFASRITALAIATALFAIYLIYFYLDGSPRFSTLSKAYAAQDMSLVDVGHQALVSQLMLSWMGLSGAVRGFLFGNLQGVAWYVPALAALLQALSVWVIMRAAPVFLLPTTEYRRLVVPVGHPPNTPIKFGAVTLMGAVLTIISLLFIGAFNQAETSLRKNPDILTDSGILEQKVIQIGDEYFKQGYLQAVASAASDYQHSRELIKKQLSQQIDHNFNVMASNVDNYLDWYYSLSGEWGRIGHLFVGKLQDEMNAQLEQRLHVDEVMDTLGEQLQQARLLDARNQEAYAEKRANLKREFQIHPTFGQVLAVQKSFEPTNLPFGPKQAKSPVLASLYSHLGVSGVAGVSGSLLGRQLAQRIMTSQALKSSTKAAAKILFEFLVRRSVGEAIITGIGTTVGSVVPGAGTVVGGAMGALAGGVIMDKLMLNLDEAMNRDAYKKEILAALNQQREGLRRALDLPSP